MFTGQLARGPGRPLRPGSPVPDFATADQHGQRRAVADERGHFVLLVFYPFAFTGICTSELHELNGHLPDIRSLNAELWAVSVDSVYALRTFGDQEGLRFPLLSDFWPHGSIARRYGVFNEPRGCAVRGSFLIDRDGALAWSVVQEIGEHRDISAHLEVLRRVAS